MVTVDVLRYYLELDSKKFRADAKKAEAQTKRVSNAMGGLGKKVMQLAGAYLGVQGLRFAITATTKAMANFEQGMADVYTLLDISEKQFQKLNKGVLEIAKTSPKTIDDLTKGLYDLISAGVSTENALWALNEAQKAAVGGSSSIKTAVGGAMGTINAYNKSISDLTSVFDMQFNVVRYGVITFDQLAKVIGRTLPSAKILGVSLAEVHAAMALITKKGLDAEESATALNMTFLALADPVKQEAFEKLGLELYDVNEQFIGMEKFLRQVSDKIDGMSDKQRATFFGLLSLQGRAIKGFVNMADSVDEYNKLLDTMLESGERDRAFEKMRDTLTNMWAILKNQFEVTMIEFGNRHMETLKIMINAAGEFVRLIGEAATATTQFLAIVSNSVTAMWESIKTVWFAGIHEIMQAIADMLYELRKLFGDEIIPLEVIADIGTAGRRALMKSLQAVKGVEDATLATLEAGEKYLDSLGEMGKALKNIIDIFRGINKETAEIAFNLDKSSKSATAMGSGFIGPMPEGAAYPSPFDPDVISSIEELNTALLETASIIESAVIGALDALSMELSQTGQRIYSFARSLATGDWMGAAFQAVRGLIDMFTGDAKREKQRAEEAVVALRNHSDQIDRNIASIENLTTAERRAMQEQVRTEIARIQAELRMKDLNARETQNLVDAMEIWRRQLVAVTEALADEAIIRGIESFEDLMNYISGQKDLDVQGAQQLASTFTRLLDLSVEEQIEMWEAIRQALIDNGNATVWELLDIENILQDLYDQAEQEQQRDISVARPESQIMRSITMITEHQANLMLSILNSIYITLREFLDEFRNLAGNLHLGGATASTGGSNYYITATGSTGQEIARSIANEFRARGIKAG